MIVDTDEWHTDPDLQALPTLDILLAFEDYSRVREREFEEQMRRAQVEKVRKERKAREGFRVRLYLMLRWPCIDSIVFRSCCRSLWTTAR